MWFLIRVGGLDGCVYSVGNGMGGLVDWGSIFDFDFDFDLGFSSLEVCLSFFCSVRFSFPRLFLFFFLYFSFPFLLPGRGSCVRCVGGCFPVMVAGLMGLGGVCGLGGDGGASGVFLGGLRWIAGGRWGCWGVGFSHSGIVLLWGGGC